MTAEVVVEKRAQTLNDTAFQDRGPITVKQTKASFAGCPVSDRKLFPSSSCILPISIMGSKEHEGQRFMATMKLINSSFKSCTLLVVDSLYRHTLRIEHHDTDNAVLYDMAIEAGDMWLARNYDAYHGLTIPHSMIRWDTYNSYPNFGQQMAIISNLYDTDHEYQKTVNTNAQDYLARYLNRTTNKTVDSKEAFAACVAYLKEECAVMCLWVEEGYHFEVHPTGRCLAMRITYQRLIEPLYPNLLKSVGIRFKKH